MFMFPSKNLPRILNARSAHLTAFGVILIIIFIFTSSHCEALEITLRTFDFFFRSTFGWKTLAEKGFGGENLGGLNPWSTTYKVRRSKGLRTPDEDRIFADPKTVAWLSPNIGTPTEGAEPAGRSEYKRRGQI